MISNSNLDNSSVDSPEQAPLPPSKKSIQVAQLELAKQVAGTLIRDCPENTCNDIRNAFSRAIKELLA